MAYGRIRAPRSPRGLHSHRLTSDQLVKLHFLSRSLHDDGHVSRNNSAGHLQAWASIAEISELSIPSRVFAGVPGLNAKVRSIRKMPAIGRSLIDRIKEETSSPGPHVLLHTIMSPWDLRVARRLGPVWDRFDHRVANVIENVDSVNRATRFRGFTDLRLLTPLETTQTRSVGARFVRLDP